MIDQTSMLHSELVAIVGAEHVRQARLSDAIDDVQPLWIIAPADVDQVAQVLQLANGASLRVAPRGGGSKLDWGNPPSSLDLILSTARLDQVVEHAWGDMTATVRAGCTVAHVQQVLAAHGQRLALDPLWPAAATIGGILATNDSGALRIRFGGLRDLILGITVVLPDGTIARSGGKVVKNVAGYDLPKLMTGALGTLGVIVEATFRLYPLPGASHTASLHAPSVATLLELLLKLLDSTLMPTGAQLQVGSDTAPRLDVRFEGLPAAIDAHVQHLRRIRTEVKGAIGMGDQVAPAWEARDLLWQNSDDAVLAKVSVLPTQFADLIGSVARVARPLRLQWQLVAQAFGLGTLRLDAANDQVLLTALTLLRGEVARLGGSLVAQHCPPSLKGRFDVWGAVGTAQPLMQRVKQHFDPNTILNPGRYMGGL